MNKVKEFQETIWDYYRRHERDLPWRKPDQQNSIDPYKILISEIMLQQTQVIRVIPKYQEFLAQFPNIQVLSQSSLGDVLKAWNGLGYNRRAKYLHEAAKQLADKTTWTLQDLLACKGIGHNTAAAIITYVYNQPVAFIETNIRTVYIHHFLNGQDSVDDKELLALAEQTMDRENPREWHWALMDYGAYVKSRIGNLAQSSKHYAKQPSFKGSKRQLRGQIIRLLVGKPITDKALRRSISDERLDQVLSDLRHEGLIGRTKSLHHLI